MAPCALRQYGAVTGAPVTAGLVQAGLSHYDRMAREIGTYDTVQLILDTHLAASEQLVAARRFDLLVWPETVYPTTFGAPKSADGAAFDARIAAFVERTRVPLLFGSYDTDRAAPGSAEFNAAFLLVPDAAPADAPAYRKALLFPFTERVPAWLDHPAVRRALPWLGTWQPGTGRRLFAVPLAGGRSLRIAPLICYDAVDPAPALAAARDGAELLVTLSNDSWFAAGNGPRLHLVVSAFRSIETRRPQVRATNTGVSAMIDATGALLETLDVGARGTLAASVVPRAGARTLLLAWGNWFPPAAAALAVALTVAAVVRRRNTPHAPS